MRSRLRVRKAQHYYPVKGRCGKVHTRYKIQALSLYLGFDSPARSKVNTKNKASLLVYSRKSGRLVIEVEDASGVILVKD